MTLLVLGSKWNNKWYFPSISLASSRVNSGAIPKLSNTCPLWWYQHFVLHHHWHCQVLNLWPIIMERHMPQHSQLQGLDKNDGVLSPITMSTVSMESTRETYLFEHVIGLKIFSWAFFEEKHFEKFKFSIQKYQGFKNYLISIMDNFCFLHQINFSASFGVTELWKKQHLEAKYFWPNIFKNL